MSIKKDYEDINFSIEALQKYLDNEDKYKKVEEALDTLKLKCAPKYVNGEFIGYNCLIDEFSNWLTQDLIPRKSHE